MIRSLVLAAALLAAPAAYAQDAQPDPPSPGGGYGRNASPEMRAAREKTMASCQADFAKFCADAQTGGGAGGGGRMQCIREHAADLSEGCKTAMQSMRELRRAGGAPAAAPSPQG